MSLIIRKRDEEEKKSSLLRPEDARMQREGTPSLLPNNWRERRGRELAPWKREEKEGYRGRSCSPFLREKPKFTFWSNSLFLPS